MSDCEHCGAHLAEDAAWCGQCLRPVSVPAEAPAEAPVGRRVVGTEPHVRAEYSRWRGGPTSFGPPVKIAITIFVLAMGPIGGLAQYRALWFVAWAPVSALILWGTWRKQRVS